ISGNRLRDGSRYQAVAVRAVSINKKVVFPSVGPGRKIQPRIQGLIRTIARADTQLKRTLALFRNNINDPGQRIAAPERRGGPFNHLYLLYISYGNAIQIEGAGRAANQRLSVNHNFSIFR